MDVRPKQFARNGRYASNSDYTLVESLAVPEKHGDHYEYDRPRRKTSRSLTTSPLTHRRKTSAGAINPPTYNSLRPAYSTTSFDGDFGERFANEFPQKVKMNGKGENHTRSSSTGGGILKKVKSTESIEMVDEFDPAGPLLASSRKSLCGAQDNATHQETASKSKTTKPIKNNIAPSDTLVLNDDEYAQYVQLSQNMVLQHQVKVKMPFPAGSVIYIRGREVILAIALFFFLTLSLGLVVAITREKINANMQKNSTASSSNGEPKCTEEFCTTPALMRQLGNFTFNPCIHFWNYSCGGWLKNNTIPEYQNSWDVSKAIESKVDNRIRDLLESKHSSNETLHKDEASNKARLMYQQCMRPFNTADNLNTLVQDLWKLQGSASGNNIKGFYSPDGMTILGRVKWKYWTSVFFEVWVAPDDKNNEIMRIQFDQGGLNLGQREEYLPNDTTNVTSMKVEHYKSFMRELTFPGLPDHFVESTYAFEQKLAEIHVAESSAERQDPDLQYNVVTVDDLNQLTPEIEWVQFLQKKFSNVTKDTKVLITNENYFRNLSKLFKNTDFVVLKQYMFWSVVFKYAKELSPKLRSAAHAFQIALEGLGSVEERWKYCVRMVGDWLNAAVGALYVRNYISNDTIKQLEHMVEDMKSEFITSLRKARWMSRNTTEAAINKLDKMTQTIGYPRYLLDQRKIAEIYQEFRVTANESFFQSLLHGIHNEGHLLAIQLNTHSYPQRPDVGPHDVTAFYTWPLNRILLQSGILEPPHYQKEVNRVVNYGGIGSIIGHEMVHAFDRMGILYDGDGALNSWWSHKSNRDYEKKLKCIVDQYSKYSLNGGMHIHGDMTLGENMADIEGLKLALKAWKKQNSPHDTISTAHSTRQHTPDQLLFIAFAQNMCGKSRREESALMSVHAPPQIRVRGSLSNVEEFSKAFNCPAGSPYNPRNKCSVWD